MARSVTFKEIFQEYADCTSCQSRLLIELQSNGSKVEAQAGSVVFNHEEISVEEIKASAHRVSRQVEHKNWMVDGMDCGGCKTTIERAAHTVEGVKAVQLNFMSRKLLVEYERNADTNKIKQIVEKLGYKVSAEVQPIETQNAEGVETESSDEVWWKRAAAKYVFLAFALNVAAFAIVQIGNVESVWPFVVSVAISGRPIFLKAFRQAQTRNFFSIEMLMSIAAIGSVFIGAAEEAAMVVFLFLIGELLEGVATSKARSGLKNLLELSPKTATLVQDDKRSTVAVSSLRRNDKVEVKPGERVPTDGVIYEGQAQVDESLITGESVPVHRRIGEKVVAGSIVTDSVIRFQVSAVASENTLSRMVELVENIERDKAPTARFIDQFSRVYTPIIFALAVLVTIVPPLLFDESWMVWIYRGLTLLLIGCPCALVLSVPAAITSAISSATRHGVLIKSGEALESIGRLKNIAFDKTGTLTHGRMSVSALLPTPNSQESTLLSLAASIEQGSTHPIAQAILAKAKEQNLTISAADSVTVLPGRGAHGLIGGSKIYVVSHKFASELFQIEPSFNERINQTKKMGQTIVVVLQDARGGREILGAIALSDELRAEAPKAIQQLSEMNLKPVMLTGDNSATAQHIASIVKLDFKAQLLPEEKLAQIKLLRDSGGVIMVGDGINDAPALIAANVGVAMGAGTDVAIESSPVVVTQNSLFGIVELVRLSRRTMRVIRQNVVLSVGLKVLFLVTTVMGVTGLWPAVLADTGATVFVTLNSLRLLRFRS